MKGRLTCKQVNTAIDELNKAVDAKYVMLKTSKSHMTEAVRRAIRQYKDQETKETKGVYGIIASRPICLNMILYINNYAVHLLPVCCRFQLELCCIVHSVSHGNC